PARPARLDAAEQVRIESDRLRSARREHVPGRVLVTADSRVGRLTQTLAMDADIAGANQGVDVVVAAGGLENLCKLDALVADPLQDSPISLVHVNERTASTVSSWPSRERREPRERLSACRPARISNKGKLDSFVESDEGPVDRVVQFQETYGPQRHRMCSNLPTESKSYWRFKSDQRSTLSREPGAWLPAPSGTETPPLSFHQGARLLLRTREL